VISIAKEYTKKSDEAEAIQAFQEVLNSSSMWHNNGSFPKNESDEIAFKNCTSPETAVQYCPVRWKAVNKYVKYSGTPSVLSPISHKSIKGVLEIRK